MTTDGDASSAHAHHLTYLHSPIGAPGSGAGRYAAAMYFYQQGVMSAELLEIFRCCAKFDHEDPKALARYTGVDLTGLPAPIDSKAKTI